jgi:hypothetical protein
MIGWAQSAVQRGTRPALQHWFDGADEVSACGDSTRLVCFGNEVGPAPKDVCAACLQIWIAWRGIAPVTERQK